MAKIEGIRELRASLSNINQKVERLVSVSVGYTQSYAIYVHENLEAHHPVGQAKYLEQPARVHEQDLRVLVDRLLKNGVPMAKALLAAGLLLQRESQKLVPVDTGALKGSAFTRQDKIT